MTQTIVESCEGREVNAGAWRVAWCARCAFQKRRAVDGMVRDERQAWRSSARDKEWMEVERRVRPRAAGVSASTTCECSNSSTTHRHGNKDRIEEDVAQAMHAAVLGPR